MKFASYNIQFGIGLDGRFDLERIAESLEGADVIALQEVTRGFDRNGHVDMVARLSDLFPGYVHRYGVGCDVTTGQENIGGRIVERRFQFGNMILSRFPILASRTLLLPRNRTFDKLNLQRAATEAVIEVPGGPIRVYSVHLDHVSPDERIAQIRYLKDRAFRFVEEGGALTGTSEFKVAQPPLPEEFVLMGDFNMAPESPDYVEMVGRRDHYYGRPSRSGFLVDALDRCGALGPDSYSWIDSNNHSERQHLDYCFVSPGLAPRLEGAWVDAKAMGSDHLPVWIVLGAAGAA